MLKSQLRHAYCVLILCLCFVQVSTLKVDRESSSVHVAAEAVKRDSAAAVSWEALVSSSDSADVAHSPPLLFASTRLRKSGDSVFGYSSNVVLIAVLAIWLVIAVACVAAPWTGADDKLSLMSPRTPRSPRGSDAQIARRISVMSAMPDAQSQNGVGSFATRYQQSEGDDRQALELLLRCSVISQEEFYSDHVSLEHIEECIWVAKVMLLKKPLEVWVAVGAEGGNKSFKDTVAAINSARENERLNNNEDVSYPPDSYAPRNDPPDSPNEPMFSPGSLQKDFSAVSLGSSVSFGVEDPARESGAGSPPHKPPSAPPTVLSVGGNVPPTIPPVPPQSMAAGDPPLKAPVSPVPLLNCYSQAEKNPPMVHPPPMDQDWTHLQDTRPLPEKFPQRGLSKGLQNVEDFAPPSSNEALQSGMPSAASLGPEGGGFLSVFSPDPSSAPPPASQGTVYQLTPSPSQQEPFYRLTPCPSGLSLTAPMPSTAGQLDNVGLSPSSSVSLSPQKRFAFAAQEVMAPPPDPSTPEEDEPSRRTSSKELLPASLRGLPDGAARRINTNPDLSKSQLR